MPIDPQLFLSYGRPDEDLALQIAAELWDRRIDCYRATPTMEQGRDDPDHAGRLYATRFFVGVISADTVWRERVVNDLLGVWRLNKLRLDEIPVACVTTDAILEAGPYPADERPPVIDPTRSGSVGAIVDGLLTLMGEGLVAQCQARWDLNRKLDPEAWRARGAALAESRGADAGLPDAAALMTLEVRNTRLEAELKGELEAIGADANRWIFLLSLAPILEHAGPAMGEELRCLVPRLVRLGRQAPLVQQALQDPVEPKTYGPDERVADTAGVIRALRRTQMALDRMRCDDALAIVRRVTWPVTRRLLLCAVDYCASGLGDAATRRAISDEMRLAESAAPD